MTTSQTFSLSKPQGGDRIARSTLAYFQARNRNKLYDLVLSAFFESGLSQAELGRRLGKGSDQICRWLGAPGNWTLDTVSDLLFAINGSEANFSLSDPFAAKETNAAKPEWAIEKAPIKLAHIEDAAHG